jgi:hypothetical protein
VFVVVVRVIGSSFFADEFHTKKMYNIAMLVRDFMEFMCMCLFMNMERNVWNMRAANVLSCKEEVHFFGKNDIKRSFNFYMIV